MDEFIDSVWSQETKLNIVKTGNAVAGVAGFGLLFTPLAPIGITTLIWSGVTSIATLSGDWINDSINSGTF